MLDIDLEIIQAFNDKIESNVKEYNNLNNETIKLSLEKKKKETELSSLLGDAARVKRLELESLQKKIDSNVKQLADRNKEIESYRKKTEDFNKTPDIKKGLNVEGGVNTEDFGSASIDDITEAQKEIETSRINASRKTQGDLNIDNADTGGFEENIANDSNQISEVRSDKSLYNGLKSYDTNDIINERKKYYNSQDKTDGFLLPWDGRVGLSYSSTQSIGNYMPYGDEWVGSPALMNPYALIRFEHIAGKNHHRSIIDQRGNPGFRGTIYKPYANINDYQNQVSVTSNGVGDNQVSFLGDSNRNRAELGVTDGDGQIYADDTGLLYVNEIDYSEEIWKPTKDVSYSKGTYKKTDDPPLVTVNTPLSGQNQEANRANEIAKMRSEFQLKKNYSGTYNTVDPKQLAEEANNGLKPTSIDFWLQKQGWIKCKGSDGVEIYVEPQYCEGGNIKSGNAKELAAQLKNDASKTKDYIQLQISRGWIKQENGTKKRYLKKPNSAPIIKEPLEPNADNLTNSENWRGKEQFQYRWTDFLYCSYYEKIPNNYLLTLRRYPMPVNDSAVVPDQDKTKQHLLPVSQAVTWMGAQTGNTVGELMSFSYHMNWRDLKAEINEIQGNEQGAESSPFGEGVSKWLGIISGESNFNSVSGWDEQRAKFDPYKDGAYANRIYGPVNVIDKTKARDRGLEFEHSINLNFHYSLTSIGGINPKAAMLDILANILALTYNNANFWGGANRYFPNKPAYPFLGGKKGMNAWYSGNATGFLDGLADQLTGALKNVGSFLQNLITNPREALSGLASKGTQLWMAEKQKDKRPGILGLKALLTGDPVGEWHLVVGNPFNPIMMIGNLICTSTKITFSDQIGADDFPEEMIVSISLDHGMPRDKGSIESMYNRGAGRLHYSYFGENTEFWNNASSTKDSKIDQSYKSNAQSKLDVNGGGTITKNLDQTSGGGGVNNAWTTPQSSLLQGRMYGSNTKQAINLSEKIGFKSGG